MRTAIFQYTCRLCGETYNDTHTSEQNARTVLICTAHRQPMPSHLFGTQPEMIGLHAGCKSGYGVSDLIGYVVEDE